MLEKEKIHWRRLKNLFKAIDSISGKLVSWPIIVVLVSIAHYCFAAMHFLFETYLYLFNRDQFELNMVSLSKRLA